MRDAARALREAGAVVERVELGWTRAVQDGWFVLWQVYFAALVGEHLERVAGAHGPGGREADRGRAEGGRRRLQAPRARADGSGTGSPPCSAASTLLCPTMAQPPQPVGGVDSDWGGDLPDGGRRSWT